MDPVKRPLEKISEKGAHKRKRSDTFNLEGTCFLCGLSKDTAKYEGGLFCWKNAVTPNGSPIYVHVNCVTINGSYTENTELISEVAKSPEKYHCSRGKDCECKVRSGAVISCKAPACTLKYHFRCALLSGVVVPSGDFYCNAHQSTANIVIEAKKKELKWPNEMSYVYNNNWDTISKEDLHILERERFGAPWGHFVNIKLQISKITDSHWAWEPNNTYDVRALEDIKKRQPICEIVGIVRKLDLNSVGPNNMTILQYPPDFTGVTITQQHTEKIAIDSRTCGNEGCYINCINEKAMLLHLKPNAHVRTVWAMGKLKAVVESIQKIKRGDSIIIESESDFFGSQQVVLKDSTESEPSGRRRRSSVKKEPSPQKQKDGKKAKQGEKAKAKSKEREKPDESEKQDDSEKPDESEEPMMEDVPEGKDLEENRLLISYGGNYAVEELEREVERQARIREQRQREQREREQREREKREQDQREQQEREEQEQEKDKGNRQKERPKNTLEAIAPLKNRMTVIEKHYEIDFSAAENDYLKFSVKTMLDFKRDLQDLEQSTQKEIKKHETLVEIAKQIKQALSTCEEEYVTNYFRPAKELADTAELQHAIEELQQIREPVAKALKSVREVISSLFSDPK